VDGDVGGLSGVMLNFLNLGNELVLLYFDASDGLLWISSLFSRGLLQI